MNLSLLFFFIIFLEVGIFESKVVKVNIKKLDAAAQDLFQRIFDYKISQNLPNLNHSSFFQSLASKISKKLASTGKIQNPEIISNKYNLYVRIDYLNGQDSLNSTYYGKQYCFDNYSGFKYLNPYEISDNCLDGDMGLEIQKFIDFGYGREKDSKSNVVAVYLYGYKKNVTEEKEIDPLETLSKKPNIIVHSQNKTKANNSKATSLKIINKSKINLTKLDSAILNNLKVAIEYKMINILSSIKLNSDFQRLAFLTAKKISATGLIATNPKINFKNKNILSRVDYLTVDDSSFKGKQYCFDNYSKIKYKKVYEIDENCVTDGELANFTDFGYGRFIDSKYNVVVVYLYGYDKTNKTELNIKNKLFHDNKKNPINLKYKIKHPTFSNSKFNFTKLELFSEENFKKFVEYKANSSLEPITKNHDFKKLALLTAKKIASSGLISNPKFDFKHKNILSQIYYLTNEDSDKGFIGKQYCLDNYSKITYKKMYEMSENCIIDSEINLFTDFGYDKFSDSKSNVVLVYLYGYDKNKQNNSSMVNHISQLSNQI